MSLFALDEVKCRVTELMVVSLFVGVAAERVMRVPTRALFRAAIRSMSAQSATKSSFERPRIFTSRLPATTCCSPVSSEVTRKLLVPVLAVTSYALMIVLNASFFGTCDGNDVRFCSAKSPVFILDV